MERKILYSEYGRQYECDKCSVFFKCRMPIGVQFISTYCPNNKKPKWALESFKHIRKKIKNGDFD